MGAARNQKDSPSKPGTSSGGGGTLTGIKKTTSTFKKKRKTTHFTPSKEKIFNFFERQGDGIVVESSPALRSKAKLSTEGQLHSGANTHHQVELQARPSRQHGKKA